MDIYDGGSDKAIKGLTVTDVNRALQFCIHVYLNLRLQSRSAEKWRKKENYKNYF